MTTSLVSTRTITRAFAELRALCDPRGYGLLDALERTMLVEAASVQALRKEVNDFLSDAGHGPSVVARIDDYSRKVW